MDEESKIGTIPLPPEGPAYSGNVARSGKVNGSLKCDNCGKVGHLEDRCYEKNKERCDYCGGWNHAEDDCRTKEFQKRNKKGPFAGYASINHCSQAKSNWSDSGMGRRLDKRKLRVGIERALSARLKNSITIWRNISET